MGRGEAGREVERSPARRVGFGERFVAARPHAVEEGGAVGEAGVGEGVVGIDPGGAAKHLAREQQALLVEAIEELAAAQVALVGLDAAGRRRRGRPALDLGEHAAQRLGDGERDLLLHREDVGELAIVAPRPLLVAAHRIDQLEGDAQALAGLPHRALEDALDAEALADGAHVAGVTLELEGGGARGDAQAGEARQGVDQLLGHAFAEIVLVARRAHVGKGQHGDRRRRPAGGRGPSPEPPVLPDSPERRAGEPAPPGNWLSSSLSRARAAG